MKKSLFFTALVAFALTASAQQIQYTVNGICKDNGKKVLLYDRLTNNQIGAATVADGKFAFSGQADKNALMGVMPEGGDWITTFFNDGTPVAINLNDSTLKGSPMNERLVRLDLDINAPYGNLIYKIQSMTPEERENKKLELANSLMSLMTMMMGELEKVFKTERDNMIPVAFVGDYLNYFGQEKFDSVLATKPAYASHPFVQKLKATADREQAAEAKKNAFIGQQFTDLEEADTDGQLHKLSEYVGKGRWVLVDFWASWCGPCRSEMPNVVAAYEKYHAKGFDIVGLSFDNKKEPWVKAIADLKMPWVHLSDLKGWKTVASDVYNVNSIPDNLLIDPQGKIIARGLRAEGLQTKLAEVFGQ